MQLLIVCHFCVLHCPCAINKNIILGPNEFIYLSSLVLTQWCVLPVLDHHKINKVAVTRHDKWIKIQQIVDSSHIGAEIPCKKAKRLPFPVGINLSGNCMHTSPLAVECY